jgi:hypothetical protein
LQSLKNPLLDAVPFESLVVGSHMSVAPFFQEDTEAALMQQVEWLQKNAQLSDQFFLNLLKVDERIFSRWKMEDGELSEDLQEHLREFWQMTLHILSFVNFNLRLLKMMLEHSLDAQVGPVRSAFDPPWLGTSLRAYLETYGIAGARKVNQWVHTMRFGDPS